eukprot:TRINITY_DN34602_c0_g1_i1.p1 TRINITY_DN34602_c0_g1~~TRINITY_DN34602_c0_g1_i1.p1  ORF type:complete len:382 (+),score=79.09 TRINITY_DN34602_c0_g1_i1:96-1241(+)
MQGPLRALLAVDVPVTTRQYSALLGFLRLTLNAFAVLFVIGKVVVIDRGYLASDVPVGIARPTLAAARPVNVSTLPYCRRPRHDSSGYLGCVLWDVHDMRQGGDAPNTVSAVTAVESVQQTRACLGCPWRNVAGGKARSRVAGVDEVLVRIEQLYLSPRFYQEWIDDNPFESVELNPWWGTHETLPGYLVDHRNRVLQRFATLRGADVVSVRALLHAAGADLSQPGTGPGSPGARHRSPTLRDTGGVLFVTLAYHNRPLAHSSPVAGGPGGETMLEWLARESVLSPGVADVYYTYRVTRLPTAGHGTSEVVWGNSSHRTVEWRRSVQVCIVHTGEILRPSGSLLILTLSAAITLWQFSGALVTSLAGRLQRTSGRLRASPM